MSNITPNSAKAISDLCVRCGLCCSGALFDHGDMRPGEAAIWEPKGLSVTTIPGKQPGTMRYAFSMPCQYLAGSTCSRYQLDRPAVCSSFFCKLALALADGQANEADAHQILTRTKGLLAALQPYMKPGESWPQMRQRWRALETDSEPDPNDARFRVMMAALQIWLNRHFRKTKGGETHPMF